MTLSKNEAFSRILIDKALEASGWNLLDPQQVQFEHNTANGRADYLLKDNLGRVLCVLEAKREDLDPYDAKEQARGYAENLKAPFVILSNSREHWFWNYERAEQRDAYRIERLPSRDDLERVRLKIYSHRARFKPKSSAPNTSANCAPTLPCVATRFAPWKKLPGATTKTVAAGSCWKWRPAQARRSSAPR